MIFDAHCHAWRRWPYDRWVPDPDTRGSIEALLYEMDTHGVDAATVVCARIGGGMGGDGFINEDNNDYVTAFARSHPDRIQALVDVDCSWRHEYHTSGGADRLRAELDRTGARGFTHYFGPVNDGWLRSDLGRDFFRAAAERGAVASLSIRTPWFEDLADIAAAFPSVPILVHHMSHPRRDSAKYESDTAALCALARHPSIGVKVSGFNYNSTKKWDFPYPQAQLLLRRIHEAFGPGRLYWGSDFPASRDMLTYTQAIEVVRTHCGDLGEGDVALILGGNLARLLNSSATVGETAHPDQETHECHQP